MRQTETIVPIVKEKRKNSTFFKNKNERASQPFFQPKLTIGPVDDPYEREADAVAEKVMRMSDREQIQTKISPAELQRKCAKCEEEEKAQRKGNGKSNSPVEAPGIVSQAIQSGGKALDAGTKDFMESRIGYDFSNVQIHTDPVAAKSAQAINALAYTSGNNIVFNQGQYAPGTENGKKLLAHELTHVVQQQQVQPLVQRVDFGPLGGKCCNSSPGVEWALVGAGNWMRLEPGDCSPLMEDCDGITCGGGFYHAGGLAGAFILPSICKTPRQDDWYFRERRWTPTVAGSEAMSPTARGARSDTPPGYQYD